MIEKDHPVLLVLNSKGKMKADHGTVFLHSSSTRLSELSKVDSESKKKILQVRGEARTLFPFLLSELFFFYLYLNNMCTYSMDCYMHVLLLLLSWAQLERD